MRRSALAARVNRRALSSRWAIVQPEKVLAKMEMERLVALYSSLGITAKFFTDPAEALQWLEGQ